jgi:hypothetical protein
VGLSGNGHPDPARRNPDAQIWINHPGEVLQSGYGRPSYWGGSGTLPRVQQYRGLAVVVFDCSAEQPDFTHAWFPREMFDDRQSIAGRVGRSRRRLRALIKASGPLELVTTGRPPATSFGSPATRRPGSCGWATAHVGSLDGFACASVQLACREGGRRR